MMLTGYTEMNVAVEAINRGEIYRLITKPWNDDELRATIRQAFDHDDLKDEIKRLNQVTREQNFKLQDMNRNLEGKVRERTKQLAAKHQELRTAYVQTIGALAEAVDAKDAYTRGHSERVGVYASKIAREMGFTQGVHRARLHRGAAPRRRQDRRARPRHHEAGPPRRQRSTRRSSSTPRSARRSSSRSTSSPTSSPCVRHHHEWFDGCDRGYPGRLRGRPDPPAVAHHPGGRHRRGDDERPPLPQGAAARRRARGAAQVRGQPVRPGLRRRRSCALLDREGESFIRKDQKFDIYEFIEG